MQRRALTHASRGSGPDRQAGAATRRWAAIGVLGAGAASSAIWLLAGLSTGAALAIFACIMLVGLMALHVADHIAEFLDR